MSNCCPDVYYCPTSDDTECPRHSGFTICCDRPEKHMLLQDRATWHASQDAEEQAWLDDWIRGRICAVTLDVCPARQPAVAAEPALTTARSR